MDNVNAFKGHTSLLIKSLECQLAYYSKQYPTMLRSLTALSKKPQVTSPTHLSKATTMNPHSAPETGTSSSHYVEFFQLNSLGCMELRAGKPTSAISFFIKALNKITLIEQESSSPNYGELARSELISVQSKKHRILHNLALGHYQSGNYEVALKLFDKVVAENQYNHLFWYRYSVCTINYFLVQVESLCAKNPNELLEHLDSEDPQYSNRDDAGPPGHGFVKRFFLRTDRQRAKVPKHLLEKAIS